MAEALCKIIEALSLLWRVQNGEIKRKLRKRRGKLRVQSGSVDISFPRHQLEKPMLQLLFQLESTIYEVWKRTSGEF
jgi:hypothetical protein